MNTTHITPADATHAAELALGRILRMGARPTQPGDTEEYERCRRIILDALDPSGAVQALATRPRGRR